MEPSKINLTCSPNTFMRVQTDATYQQELVSQVVQRENQDFDEIIFSKISSEELCNIDEASGNTKLALDETAGIEIADGKKNEWVDGSTKLLISLVKELRPLVGKSMKLKSKKKMWCVIADKLCEKGHFYSDKQVEAKYYGLERQYKKNKLHNSQTGRNRQTCPYQTELDDLLAERKGINPEYVLDEETVVSATDVEPEEEDVLLDSGTSTNADTSTSLDISIKKSRRKTVKEQIVENMDKISEDMKRFEEKTIHFLELKEQRDKRKEERAEREEERKKRKLELLETLVAKLSKQ